MSTDWNNYTCFDVNFYPKKISPLELQNGLLKIYKQVYSTEIGIKRADYFKNIFLESAESKIKILKESNL